MRKYQLTFLVPNDFDPDQWQLESKYKYNLEIIDEGFTDVPISELSAIIRDKLDVLPTRIEDDSVILFKCPKVLYQVPEYIHFLQAEIEKETGKTAVAIVEDINIIVQNSDTAIQMLEDTIQKIKDRKKLLEESAPVADEVLPQAETTEGSPEEASSEESSDN